MRYYIRKPDGAIMTAAEWRTAPHCGRTAYRASFGENYFAHPLNAAMFAAECGDGYRVVTADSQPPDHETRYFIRKPNGMLIEDVDDARRYFCQAYHYHLRFWDYGFVYRKYALAVAHSMGKGFAVVPREILTGRDA